MRQLASLCFVGAMAHCALAAYLKYSSLAILQDPRAFADRNRRNFIAASFVILLWLTMLAVIAGGFAVISDVPFWFGFWFLPFGSVLALTILALPAIPLIVLVGRARTWIRARRRTRQKPAATEQEAKEFRDRWRREQEAQRQGLWQLQLKSLIFPYELVSGAQAEGAYEMAREQGRAEGFVPLIITPDSVLPNWSREELMAEAQRILSAVGPAEEFFAERRAKSERFPEDGEWRRVVAEAEAFALAAPGPAPAYVDNGMGALTDVRGTRLPFARFEEAAVVRIPTSRSWEIPAYTLFSGGVGGPKPEQMVAVARSWNEKYGADICAIGKPVTLEFRIARPPADQREALAFMREQMVFCNEAMHELLYEPSAFREEVTGLRHRKYLMCWWDV
jgi:hypothetical protein